MKTILSILLLFTFNSAFSQLFSIEIEESSMFIQNNYKISQDCITADLTVLIGDSTNSYSKVVSKADRKAITNVLDKINFESLRKSYSNDFADDLPEYKFKIKYKNIDREIHIYDVRLRPMLNLVAKINILLSLEYRIRYDKNYGSRR